MATRTSVIWERLDRPSRGPQPAWSHDQIVKVAIGIADGHGLEALTMRRLATAVDAGTMTLYRYLTGKDDLLELMFDAILDEIPVPDEPSGNWRLDLTALARQIRQLGHRHPWSVLHALGRPTFGPNALRRTEYMLACLGGLGLTIDEMQEILEMVRAFVTGFVHDELAERETQRRSGLTEDEWREWVGPYLDKALATGRYPYLVRVVEEGNHEQDEDERFERSLRRVLDGIAADLMLR
jgi:AcrR family transcriptional regulator